MEPSGASLLVRAHIVCEMLVVLVLFGCKAEGNPSVATASGGLTASGSASGITTPGASTGVGSVTGGGSGSCATPLTLTDPDDVSGNTSLGMALADGSCESSIGGTDEVYEFISDQDGYASITLNSFHELVVFVRTDCNDDDTEMGCADVQEASHSAELHVDVRAGVPVHVFVSGHRPGVAGAYDLAITTSPHRCGDGVVSDTETCDDGNSTGGDGCDVSCQLEVTETEPNDVLGEADGYGSLREVGMITPGDQDWWWVDVTMPPGFARVELTAEVVDLLEMFGTDLGVSRCNNSEVEIYDSTGLSIAYDQDYSDCPSTVVAVTTPGTYFVRLAAPYRTLPTSGFGYGVEVTQVGVTCGDGNLTPTEACDDGNNDDGDGCSATCVVEYCGDGMVNNTYEACDDGNTIPGDGCRTDCLGTETCGDGVVDPITGERCDDGDQIAGDGCDGQCVPEPDEVEANNDHTTANPYAAPFIARIDPIGDQDYVAIDLPYVSNTLVVETSDMGGLGSCSIPFGYYYLGPLSGVVGLRIDTVVDLFDTDGTTLLETDGDDGFVGCAGIRYSGLPPGTYYVRVAESTAYIFGGTVPPSDVFDYMLHASVLP